MSQNETNVGGAVNFDSNLVPAAEQAAAQRIDAQPLTEGISFGTKMHDEAVGDDDVEVEQASEPVVDLHQQFLTVGLDLTLNSGLDFLKGLKSLKSVEIVNSNGEVGTYNFHNPFVRGDKSRDTCDGLLRALVDRIAEIVLEVHNLEIKGFDGRHEFEKALPGIVQQYVKKLVALFPVPADADLFSIDLVTADGTVYPRVVRFNEMFNVTAWHHTEENENTGAIYHQITFNLSLNLGSLYDSTERHKFVQRAYSFLEALVKTAGLHDVIPYHVNYAFASETMLDELPSQTIKGLINPEKGDPYSLVSLHAVQSGAHYWAPRDASKLFGYGCDLILRSSDPEVEDNAE